MILYTADWHIKLGQKNIPVEWAKNRYREFFAQIGKIERSVDLHIIGGDLFDRLPSMEELELYFEFIRNCSVKTFIYDGNHEATKKGHTFFSYLKDVTNSINPKVTVITEPWFFPDYGYSILPYCALHSTNSIEKLVVNQPIFTHVRGEIPPHVKPEVDLDRFSSFPIVFAGDLHSHSNTQRNIVYPGSPMTTSFHRTPVQTGYLLIDPSDWSWNWEPFALPQLIRRTVQSPKEMLPTNYDHTIYELEGDMQELAGVKNSDLLDKKVVKRNSEATLIIHKDMSILEELVEYLTYILEIGENNLKEIIGTFNDYYKEASME